MPIHHDAVDLLYAWDKEMSQGDNPTTAPFCSTVHHLLSQSRLDDALNDIAEMIPAPLGEEGLNNLMNAAHLLAMETMIGNPEDPQAPFALLVALPLFGIVSSLSLDEGFWPKVNAHLRASVTAHLGREPIQFELRPLPQSTRPEALTLLTVDHLRQLTEELGRGDLTRQAKELVDFDAEGDAVHDPIFHSTSVQVMGQRMALASLVFDPDEWAPGESLNEWLSDLDPDKAWASDFFTQERVVMPPMGLPGAMTEALAARFRLMVDVGLDDRDLHPNLNTAQLKWQVDEDPENGMMIFLPHVDGASLDPIPVPGRWLMLAGADGVQEACQAWGNQSSFTDGVTADEDDTPPEPMEATQRRRRLH